MMADGSRPSLLRRFARGLGLLAVLALMLATRLSDGPVVFADYPTEGAVDFTDGDCYARMTRVKLVLEGKGLVIRHHDFENFPAGTEPHTTAPLDWLIAVLALALRAVFPLDLASDMAGAWIGPLLGLATALFLWRWTGRWNGGRGRPAAMILFAASPILAHGQMIGRPDHQALLIFLLAVSLAGELTLLRRMDGEPADSSRVGPVMLGLAWGMALWVSLWEPLLLWLGVTAFGAIAGSSRWWTPARRSSLVVTGAVLLVALALEGVRISPPGWFSEERDAFQIWARSIGELQPVGWFSPVIVSWGTGFVLLLPFLLSMRAWRQRTLRSVSILTLALLAVTWALTSTQARWGYFFALSATLGVVVGWTQRARAARSAWGIAFAAGLWHTAAELERTWFREGPLRSNQEMRIARNRGLRAAARQIELFASRTGLDGAIAASWWDAPALSYRTRRPALTGSSHQALDGNLAYTSAMLLRPAPSGARFLRRLNVRWLAWSELERFSSSRVAGRPPRYLNVAWHPDFGEPREDSLDQALTRSGAAQREFEPTVFVLRDCAEPSWQPVE